MMTFKKFLIEKAMNPSEFKKTEERQSTNTLVGFEFECLVPENSPLNHESGLRGNELEKVIFDKISKDLSSLINQKVLIQSIARSKHMRLGHWLITSDQSIKGTSDLDVGVEIISPPIPLSKALEYLELTFKWMKDSKIETNMTTGFHINLSMPGIENIDMVKLVLFMGESHVLKEFDRMSNSFTNSQITSIKNSIIGARSLPKEASEMIALANRSLSSNKYSSVNIEKIKDGYLEFRLVGNSDYHSDFKKIKNTILRFVSALEIASDPKAERGLYLKKLSKIFSEVEDFGENRDFDSKTVKNIIEYHDGGEKISKELTTLLNKAKSGDGESIRAKRSMNHWVSDKFIPFFFNSASEMGIKTPSLRQISELKRILKNLGYDINTLDASKKSLYNLDLKLYNII